MCTFFSLLAMTERMSYNVTLESTNRSGSSRLSPVHAFHIGQFNVPSQHSGYVLGLYHAIG
jgi:hypothetical protein